MSNFSRMAVVIFCLTLPVQANERVGGSAVSEFREHVTYLASDELGGRLPGSKGWAAAAKYVIQHFKAARLVPLQDDNTWYQDFPIRGGITARNILAVRHGKGTLGREAVLVTGHYDHIGMTRAKGRPGTDHIFNGADDNAAGVSIMLMLARRLAESSDTSDNYRTVIFASFDAEEKGLLGAQHYIRNPVWPLERISVVINFDGGGRMRGKKVFASDAETNPFLATTVRKAASKYGITAETRFGGHGRSDHAVFADRGIPGVHFVTGAHSDYHQVTDEVDRLNFEGAATIASIGYDTLREMMTHPHPMTFHKLRPELDVRFGLNLARIVGIVPMVNAQEGRYPQLLYVVPGSPAAKLGLQSGDKITALDNLKFRRVEDFISIYRNIDFSDGVNISILRSGENLELILTSDVIAQFSGPPSTARLDGSFDVVFRYKPASTDVQTVYLAGEFNNWDPVDRAMQGPDENGEFHVALALPKGFHEYKFVEEGQKWKSDPRNLHTTGFYKNSVVWVGPQNLK